MNRRALEKARREIRSLRQRLGSIRPAEMIALASKLGRTRFNRGKEPTFTRAPWVPLSIPNHPGCLKPGTARNILGQLAADLEALEEEAEG